MSTETYDSNGNTVNSGGRTFAYDSENRLTSMNSGAVSIVYDGFGNRVAETAGGVTTRYLVEDDVNPTGLPQVFDELTGSVVTRTYTYGLQRVNEDQIIGGTWTPSFYGYDGAGSVRQLTNLAGTVTDTYNYDAFGNLLDSTGSTTNNYLYRGEQYDSDLGLYYLRARYMNPVTGRFMSRDPEDGKPYDPKTLHKYLYAGADPIDFRDPLGRELDEVVTLDRRSLTASEKYAAQQLGVTRRLLRVAIHAVKAAATFEGNPDVLIGVVGEAYNILGNVYLEEAEADYELIGNLFDYLP